MKPLRFYKVAWIKHRNSDEYEKVFEIQVYQNLVIYFDDKGNERVLPMYYVGEVVEYAEDREPKEVKSV